MSWLAWAAVTAACLVLGMLYRRSQRRGAGPEPEPAPTPTLPSPPLRLSRFRPQPFCPCPRCAVHRESVCVFERDAADPARVELLEVMSWNTNPEASA